MSAKRLLPKLRGAGSWMAIVAPTVILFGCGETKPQGAARELTVPKPKRPTVAQCRTSALGGAASSERPTPAGRYLYRTNGKRVVQGARKRVFKLPTATTLIITPARKVAGRWCYVSQRRYTDSLGDTATLLISGADLYLRQLRFQSGGYIKTLSPSRPLLTLSGSELDWSGVFRGTTSGRYAAEIVGRKQVKVGPVRVSAVGVKTRISYAGDIKGWERSTRWISLKRNIVLAERVMQSRRFGLDRLRLEYRSRLQSMEPR